MIMDQCTALVSIASQDPEIYVMMLCMANMKRNIKIKTFKFEGNSFLNSFLLIM